MSNLNTTSIVCPYMNRESFLNEALPTWTKLPINEIIIVDWSSTDNIAQVIDNHQNGNVWRVRINGKESYHRTKPINTGIRFASSNYILKLDSDIKVNEHIFDHLQFIDTLQGFNEIESLIDDNSKHLFGTCFFKKDMFLRVNGYNEDIENYGFEDVDFYKRLSELYEKIHISSVDMGIHIPHSDDIRLENQSNTNKINDLIESEKENIRIIDSREPWHTQIMKTHECEVFAPDGSITNKLI